MNESLAARQEALQRQNQELNQQVEAIEQRRQQHLASANRPSSSSSTTSLRGTRSASPQIESPTRKSKSLRHDEDHDQQCYSKSNLEIHLSRSIDSLGSQDLNEARRHFAKSDSKETVATGSRSNSATRSQRQKKSTGSETSPQDTSRNKKKIGASGDTSDNADPVRESDPQGLGLEATVRYQKARLRVLQDEADAAVAQTEQLQAAHNSLKTEMENLKAENATLIKRMQQTQLLLEKQRELSVAQEAKQRILEGQLAAANGRVEETQRTEKLASQQIRSKDIRLNRALEEIEKVKAQLQEEQKNHGEQMVAKADYDQVIRDNKKLDKQKGELLAAFKKQMKLIDLLKRQRIHMEAAKMLSFTEAEFSKTLELG
ncbi:Testis-expressed sequence 9 protein [Phytophthora cinnamomi]|uniref:Testis-expressed sequence 9 protein n=1 Tax=Phytophthora cinnamomi TaxID=4785 RepID=UPI00355A591C|nr:Testis-expressed sequence 9 protein [Phytophthora cinnamomi]